MPPLNLFSVIDDDDDRTEAIEREKLQTDPVHLCIPCILLTSNVHNTEQDDIHSDELIALGKSRRTHTTHFSPTHILSVA